METKSAQLEVLLIEDNPGDARLIFEYLSSSEDEIYRLTVTEKLGSAMEMLREDSFDAVLLDLTLPDSHGLATFEKIHQQSPMVPVIVLTGLDDKTTGVAAVKSGAQDYLLKGEVDRSTLVRTIRHSIERASLEQRILQSNRTLEERVELRTRELEVERERASRSEKLAIIGQLSGGFAHDLRNPLGAIKNAAFYLKRKCNAGSFDQTEDISQWIDIIEREVTTANVVITNLLSNGLTYEPKFSEIQIVDAIHDSLDSFELRKNICLSIIIDPDLPTVFADAPQMIRVFQNLVANAQDAMEHHGRLTIDAERIDDSVKIMISDTGIGISSENLGKIFEPLYSAKPHGTGLGLSVCQEIISNHNGSISVESEVGTGTTFTILIPIAR